MSALATTPYESSSPEGLMESIQPLEERVRLLRSDGLLSEQTLRAYYGETRFDQVAESNALEGSTLDVGETRLAVLKGNTMFAHDERYVRDARALHSALQKMEDLAGLKKPIDIEDARSLHELILEGRSGAGNIRRDPVMMVGSKHRPPKTWEAVMSAMEQWEAWSKAHAGAPPLLRSIVLHAWFTHIHPYIDGNGRAARALGNLELIRGGYPPVIVRNTKHRSRYIDALQVSDTGDIHDFAELIVSRAEDALRDLERAAARNQGYSPLVARERNAYARRLEMWNLAVRFLSGAIHTKLSELVESSDITMQWRDYDELELEDFMELSKGVRTGGGWGFRATLTESASAPVDLLAWASDPGETLKRELGKDAARPSLRWSVKGTGGRVPWRPAHANECPYAIRMTFQRDEWVVVTKDGIVRLKPMDLAERISSAMVERLVPHPTL